MVLAYYVYRGERQNKYINIGTDVAHIMQVGLTYP